MLISKNAAKTPKTPKTAPQAPAKKPAKTDEPKDWTVIMYLDGDNDAEERITQALRLMERKVGSTDKVNIVAQLGRLPQKKLEAIYKERNYDYEPTNVDGDWSGLRRFYVTKHDKVEDDRKIYSECTAKLAEDVHMCEPTTLADCLIDSIKKYPAKNYMVCMADHGGSLLGAMTSDGTPQGHEIMTPSQISKALELVENATGAKPALIDMAACLMASSEVAHQLKDRADYYLASQEVTSKTYQHYGSILQDLVAASEKGKPMTPQQLGKRVVKEYDDKPKVAPDKSLVNLNKVGDVTESVKDLVGALEKTKIPVLELADAILESQHFGMHGDPITSFSAQTRDLRGIGVELQKLAEEKKDKALAKAAKAVVASVEDAVVTNNAHDYERSEVVAKGSSSDGKEKTTTVVYYEGHYDAHGLSIFAPVNQMKLSKDRFADFMAKRYDHLTFAKETGWGDWLAKFNQSVVEERKKAAESDTRPEYEPIEPGQLK